VLAIHRQRLAFRIAFGFAAFIMFAALMLTMSRAGWLGLTAGTGGLLALMASRREAPDAGGKEHDRGHPIRWIFAAVTTLAFVALFFIGPDARIDTAVRVNETLSGGSDLFSRLGAWRAGLRIVRDFPLIGVGLGGWPEIFARYQSAPWSMLYFYQAHNDYVQLIAEAGLIGAVAAAWLASRAISILAAGYRKTDRESAPVFAGAIGGLIALGVVEFFDFDLRIPAIGVFFAVIAGAAMRIAAHAVPPEHPHRPSRSLSLGAAFAGLILCAAVLAQNSAPYPYNLKSTSDPAAARARLLAYPANALSHTQFLALEGDALDNTAQEHELQAAVALNPLDPVARDKYAQALARWGREQDAFDQIRLSVAMCPQGDRHWYLAPRLAPWLPADIVKPIEAGLSDALDRGYAHAADTLGDFYSERGEPAKAAAVFARASQTDADPALRTRLLRRAGEEYAKGGAWGYALRSMRSGAEITPDDTETYSDMLRLVYGPQRDLEGARHTVAIGVENGADPYALSIALADAAEAAGDRRTAEAELERALNYDPSSFKLVIRLAGVYVADAKFDSAAGAFERAIDIQPDKSELYFLLGQVEESRYRYDAAERAYRHAVALAPDSAVYRKRLDEFDRKLKEAASDPYRSDKTPLASPN
jgi:tetratricopeptide (TPR) repeat protein